MKHVVISGVSAAAASTVTVIALTAVPATAADTTATFTLAGGLLSVSAPATAALTDGNAGTTSVSGSLGQTEVTDNRGGTTGWIASAATTDFTNGTTTASAVSYDSGVVTPGGVVTAVGTGATALSAEPAAVVNATLVVGNNTATWNPTITVTLPASSTAGEYSGTITTSVL